MALTLLLQLLRLFEGLSGRTLEAFLPAQIATVLEHVATVGVQSPVGTLARPVWRPAHFDEAVVE